MPEPLKDVTPEELQKLSALLQLMRQGEQSTPSPPKEQTVKKKKKKKKKRRSRSQKKQAPEPNEEEAPTTTTRRRSKRKVKVKSHRIQAQSGPIHIGVRPNKFEVVDGKVILAGEKLPETAEERKAKQFDQAVSLKHEPTERRDESMVDAQCQGCGRVEAVSEIFLVRDPETREYSYTCNNCSMRR